ncbi:hypothetical protein [Halorhodospira halochloris]|uniref:hypothetical protein n=1 Tax=Halorhodospira halochloris TaxID=1052 RepID=UPI0013A59B62|nr:hypothetical protein [Halorhodospira halochloris]
MSPPLEASWRHPWRQDLHTGTTKWLRREAVAPLGTLRETNFGHPDTNLQPRI